MIISKYIKKTVILSLYLFSINFFLIHFSFASSYKNEIILSIIINGERRGDLICFIEENKFYLPVEELLGFGLTMIEGERIKIEEKEYLILNSWKEVKFNYNEDRAELEIFFPPHVFPERTINLYHKRRENIIIPDQNSAFLNYRVDYLNTEEKEDIILNHEAAIRFNNISFVTDGFYSEHRKRYIRLNTYGLLDNREDLTRLIFGDFITPSGPITHGNNMLGISYSRNFRIDPYFIYRPTFNISTHATYRSELEIYLDGSLIRKETVPPGKINLSNLYYYGGRRDIQLVVRDPYGRIEVLRYPFYFTDLMLKRGIREFNYSAGFLREDYSIESNNYSHFAFLAFERYGYMDSLNIGARIEGVPGTEYFNLGLESVIRIDKYGVLSLYPSVSKKANNYGSALLTSYNYQFKNLNFRTTGLIASDEYHSSHRDLSDEIRKNFTIGSSYFLGKLGGLNIDFVHNEYTNNTEENILNLGYSKSLRGNISLYANITRRYGKTDSTEFFAGINIYPKRDHTLSLRYENREGKTSQILQASKASPVGKGYGYRFTLEREEIDKTAYIMNSYLQHREDFGVFETDLSLKEKGDEIFESYRLAYSGAIAYVADRIGFIRPIRESFALIKTADVKDVEINLNGQLVGKTGSGLFVSELQSYYDNLITINDKDIPLEYDVLTKEVTVSPWHKGGFCLEFPIKRIYRYTGFLIGILGDRKIPLEFYDITVERPQDNHKNDKCIKLYQRKEDKVITIQTSKKGEFYIEDLSPGTYRAFIIYNNTPIEFEIYLPAKDEFVIDLGEIEILLPYIKKEGVTIEEIPEEQPLSQVDVAERAEGLDKEQPLSQVDVVERAESLDKEIVKVYFKFDSIKLSQKKDYFLLKELTKDLIENERIKIKLYGHCDQIGDRSYNQRLSERRARFVADYLIRHGVPKERIIDLKGYGEDLLLCYDMSEECRRWNRRVEIHLIKK